MSTRYDQVAYPAAIFPQTHPDRLAALARLHGLAPPPVDAARVLEIGGGDGLNLAAMAVAYPDARFFNFDLTASAIARGQTLTAGAGLANFDSAVLDILDAREAIAPGGYDYIIAHGVYAWVPAPVRAALFALIGHALSPGGVAFVSYNALPGGHVRRILRDMAQHALAGITGAGARMAAARAFLESYRDSDPGGDDLQKALRAQAGILLDRPDAVLFHDELGEVFEPQSLADAAGAAAAHGLCYLGEAGAGRLGDGFLARPAAPGLDETAAVIRAAQTLDYAELRGFRQSLFVRAARKPSRQPDLAALRALRISARVTRLDRTRFQTGGRDFRVEDDPLTDMLEAVGKVWPRRAPVGDFIADDPRAEALLRLFDADLVTLHAGVEPFCLAPGARPLASPLARAQIAAGHDVICALNHTLLTIESPSARELLMLLDGSRDRLAIARDWQPPKGVEIIPDWAINDLAAQALLLV